MESLTALKLSAKWYDFTHGEASMISYIRLCDICVYFMQDYGQMRLSLIHPMRTEETGQSK